MAFLDQAGENSSFIREASQAVQWRFIKGLHKGTVGKRSKIDNSDEKMLVIRTLIFIEKRTGIWQKKKTLKF